MVFTRMSKAPLDFRLPRDETPSFIYHSRCATRGSGDGRQCGLSLVQKTDEVAPGKPVLDGSDRALATKRPYFVEDGLETNWVAVTWQTLSSRATMLQLEFPFVWFQPKDQPEYTG